MEHKGFLIKNNERFPGLVISRIGKGALPGALQGLFTSCQAAKAAIDSVGGNKNAKSIETSGG